MTVPPDKLVTCVLPQGRGIRLLEALRRDKGIVSGSVHHARAAGGTSTGRRRGLRAVVERDVVHVLVPASAAEEVFEYLGREGGVDQPHGGVLYMRTLRRATTLTLPAQPASE